MKKSVALLVVLLLLCVPVLAKTTAYSRQIGTPWSPTGAQILDLPPPPAPPGSETTQPPATTPPVIQPSTPSTPTPPPPAIPGSTSDAEDILSSIPDNVENLDERVVALEQKIQVVELIPKFEDRLNDAEQKAAAASTVVERIDALQSQTDALKVDVDNVRTVANRPYVDSPTFAAALGDLEGSTRTKAIMSISLAAVSLILVVALLVMGIVQHKRAEQQNHHLAVQFLKNYQKQGYSADSLKMHLAACGWPSELIESAAKEAGESL